MLSKTLIILSFLIFLTYRNFSLEYKEIIFGYKGFNLTASSIKKDSKGNIYISGRLEYNYHGIVQLSEEEEVNILNDLVENYYSWLVKKKTENIREGRNKSNDLDKIKKEFMSKIHDIPHAYILKMNYEFKILWLRLYDFAYSGIDLDVSEENSIMLIGFTAGYRKPNNDNDLTQGVVIARINPDGNIMWNKIIDSKISSIPKKIIRTSDNNYLILADEDVSVFKMNIRLIKINPEGEVFWDLRYGNNIYGNDIKEEQNGSIIISSTFIGGGIFLIKTDKNGLVILTKKIQDDFSKFSGKNILLSENYNLVTGIDFIDGIVIFKISKEYEIIWESKPVKANALSNCKIIMTENNKIYLIYTNEKSKNEISSFNINGQSIHNFLINGENNYYYDLIDINADKNSILLIGNHYIPGEYDRAVYLIIVKSELILK